MSYYVQARDGESSLRLVRDTRQAAELAAIVLKEKGYSCVEIIELRQTQKVA
jgi:hypothetical protein